MKALVVIAYLAGGCLPTKPFPCNSDADCAGLDRGRCELADGVCSEFDSSCPSLHSYAEHAGSKSGTCVPNIEEQRLLANACVAGERAPTLHDVCGAEVCKSLPACCSSTWNEACVARAAQVCDVDCATRIVAANVNQMDMLVRTRIDPVTYAAIGNLNGMAGRVAWMRADRASQPPGRPHLVGGRNSIVTVFAPTGTDMFALENPFNNNGAMIRGIAAADTNNDGSVEIGLAFTDAQPYVVVLDGDNQIPVFDSDKAAQAIAWADFSGDRVPDFAIGTPVGYRVFERDEAGFQRHWNNEGLTGPISTVGWGDVDGDRILDLVAVGFGIAVHLGRGEDVPEAATFTERVAGATDAVAAIGDLDGDLRADVIAFPKAGATGDNLAVFSNWNGRAFPLPPFKRPSVRMHHVVLADVDHDRDLDVIGAVEMDGGLVWFENTSTIGNIVLSDPKRITEAGAPQWFAVTDW